jgi:hypothetical protein
MKLKNKELEKVLLTISAYNAETMDPVSGLLFEDITLGLKRRLQKIGAEVDKKYKEFQKDFSEINQVKEKSNEEYQNELEILLNEEVEINQEPASLKMIEEIKSKFNYDFEIIEKIAH